jgi:rfaE bifunctional protein nucleotidyltransferase chain/domain
MDKFAVIESKIHTHDSLKKSLAYWRFSDKKIVFTNGCFDLLHYGHIDYLSKASALGDVLVVGLNTDASVARLKGPSRPVNDERSRLHIMASLFYVSAVVLFDEPTPYELINLVQPDVLVKGGDYKREAIVGYDIVMKKGGEVVTLDFVPGYSTSALEKKIREYSG